MKLYNFEGAVLGYAVGDALGMANEFTNKKVFGFEDNPKKGLTKGQWTDDTQFFLMSSKSLIQNKDVILEDIIKNMVRLAPELRSVGFNTRTAINNMKSKRSNNTTGIKGQYSCGAGGVSRLLPYLLVSDNFSYGNIKNILRITHDNKDLFKVSKALAHYINRLKQKVKPEEAFETLYNNYPSKLRSSFNNYHNRGYAPGLIASSARSFTTNHNNFKRALLDSVNKAGDTDTRTALVGFFSGIYNGINEIPDEFKTQIENKSLILNYAKKLYEVYQDESL